MNPNTRKNRTNQSVVWPSASYFTIKELHKLNSKFVEITLRVRLTNAITEGKVVEIGSVPTTKGRPEKVFSMTPVQQSTLDEAKANKIHFVNNIDKLINVINVNSDTTNNVVVNPVTTTVGVS